MAAMVELFLGPIIEKLIDTALEYLKDHKEELERLRNNLPQIQAVVDYASILEQIQEKNLALSTWFWDLRDGIDEAEDVMEELTIKMEEAEVRSATTSSISGIVSKYRKIIKNDPTLKRLEEVVKKLDRVSTGVATFLQLAKEAKQEHQEQHLMLKRARDTGSLPKNNVSIGRDNEKEFVMNWLKKTSNENQTTPYSNISLLSIVGQGGMGKTTLLQQVYNESDEMEFDLKIWACVSNDFDKNSVIKAILEFVTEERPSMVTFGALQKKLKSTVSSKKFLLVLDDIWEEDENKEMNKSKWEDVLAPLASGKLGSKILVTTRMDSVAVMLSEIINKEEEKLRLEGLNDDECLQLLYSWAFKKGEDPTAYPKLRTIAEKIVKKLSGSPLAAKVIGGVLSSRLEETHWNRVLNYKVGGHKGILDILKLSYIFLPKVLRNCFSFCCTFPQDYEFDKDDLVRMWIALGFIQPDNTRVETMKDAGERYFDTLVQKSLFDKFQARDKTYCYKLHDLLHEMLRTFCTQECLSIVGGEEELLSRTPKTIRHLFLKNVNPVMLSKVEEFKHLRSFVLIYHEKHEDLVDILAKIFKILRSIRLMYIEADDLEKIPKEIEYLIHLKYLKINCYPIETTTPVSLPAFWRLPFLKYLYLYNLTKDKVYFEFHGNDKVRVFPSLQVLHINNLFALEDWFVAKAAAYECLFPCLTELHLKHCPILLEFPTGLPPKLQKLEIDSIGWKGSNWLQRISNYCSISIQHCPNLISLKGHQEIKIAEKCQLILSELTINDPSLLLMAPLTSVTSIKKLEIKDNDEVISFPIAVEQWFMQVSPSLCELVFYSLNSLQSLPSSLESLSSLKILSVEDVPLIQQLSNMPASLEQLNLAYLESLQSLPSSLESLSSLKILTVKNVPLCQLLPNMHASLEQLDLAHLKSLQSLPSSLESLSSLKILSVEDVPLLQQLSNMPASLEQLNLAYLESLQSLPSSLESLSSLKILTVKNVPLVQLLPNMPASLKELKLEELKSLQFLPSTLSFSSLEHLYLKSIPLQELPDLPTSLCELYLSRLSKLNCLPSSLSSLKKLDLYYLPELQKLPNIPFSLKEMTIWDCHPKLYENYLA